MLAYAELRNELVRLLAEEISLDSFEDWFVQRSWNMHKDSDLVAQRLAYAVELRLAEHDSGQLSESELRKELLQLSRQYLSPQYVVNQSQYPELQSGTTTSLTFIQWVVPASGKSLSVAYE